MTKLSGTLLLPVETVEKTGNLFPLMALMLRAAGMNVVVVGPGIGDTPAQRVAVLERRAAALNVPFTRAWPFPPGTSGSVRWLQQWKVDQARELLARGPVLWPDLDFQLWVGPDLSGVRGLTILNVGALLAGGMRPGLDGKTLPG